MITNYKDICLVCGAPASEMHHLVFGRGMRPLADADNLTAPLCEKCHKELHYSGLASAMSKIIGEMQWEMDYCIEHGVLNPDEAREAFRKRYARCWL